MMKTLPMRKTSTILVLVVLAGLTTVSAWAQTAAPATLSPQEREFALKYLQTTHDKFLQSIAGLSQKQWTFKPGPDRWSVAEVRTHNRSGICDSGVNPEAGHDFSRRAREARTGQGKGRDNSAENAGSQPQGAGSGNPASYRPLGHGS